MSGVVYVPDHPPRHDRLPADGRLHGLGHRPRDPRHIGWHAPVNLALEVEGDLGTPLLPPRLRGRDFAAVLQGQDVRPVRIGVGLGGIVVRGVRLTGGGTAVGAGPKLRDAQLSHHVGVVFARELVQPRPLLGAELERVRRRGRGRGCGGRGRLSPEAQRAEDTQAGEKEDASRVSHGDWSVMIVDPQPDVGRRIRRNGGAQNRSWGYDRRSIQTKKGA